jgi:RND family efflux transporter MFP subunit
MDFIDNQFDPETGTMQGRAVLPNPDQLFSPGQFVRLRLAGSGRHDAVLIPDEAVGTDQAQRFVWVVDGENRVHYRAVELGPLYEGKRIVRSGLTAADRLVVSGLQRVRPNIVVAPMEEALTAATDAAPPPSPLPSATPAS